MTGSEWATWIGVLITFLLGVGAILYSRRANLLAERTAALQAERWYVDWAISWNQAAALVVLKHIGSDSAHGVRITIAGDELHVTESPGDIGPNTDTTVAAHQIIEQRNAFERMIANSGGIIATFSNRLYVHVEWSTALGRPDHKDLWVDAH